MNPPNGIAERPKAWVDKNNIVVLRDDLSREEAQELYQMLGDAFNSGVESGYKQGLEAARG